jgi:hypothetical protein
MKRTDGAACSSTTSGHLWHANRQAREQAGTTEFQGISNSINLCQHPITLDLPATSAPTERIKAAVLPLHPHNQSHADPIATTPPPSTPGLEAQAGKQFVQDGQMESVAELEIKARHRKTEP